MICPEIIATIGLPFDEESVNIKMNNSLNNGIKSFRFNLSKCSIEEIEKLINSITKNKLMEDCNIMLDLPFPGRKTRISFKDDQFTHDFKAGEIVIITGKKSHIEDSKAEVIFVDNEDIYKAVSVGQELIYSDGDCILSVVQVDEKSGYIIAKISNTIKMYTRKSLSYNYVVKEAVNQDYIDLINRVKPSSVAFSFVTDLNSLLTCSNGILDKNIEIISKIETADSMDNVEEIATSSSLMLGRGDLILNSEIYKLYEYQVNISKITKKLNKKLYIATGILTSLRQQPIPTPAEITDLYNIMLCQPDAIILNAELIASDNVEAAVKLIRKTASVAYKQKSE
ncbi:pyruvate kinase [Bacillus toyonensis]|uniref:pyruvate kinase n=1 Tax=Bacillus toyonensis TaxID=155322 RepID=UPI000BEC80E1|nr:pyruvate kinase [Bacillus toyonensis]PDY87619.1 hypothetical protein CON67_21715 [Bacillus toyonensis]